MAMRSGWRFFRPVQRKGAKKPSHTVYQRTNGKGSYKPVGYAERIRPQHWLAVRTTSSTMLGFFRNRRNAVAAVLKAKDG
jgi:hypothetical protein